MGEGKRIGYVGLGQMGSGMVENLLKAGFPVLGFDIRPEASKRFEGKEFSMAGSVTAVIEQCEEIHTCLWGNVFYQIAEQEMLPAARKGQIFIDHSTLSAPKIRTFASRFAEKGAVLLDAPISGGTGGADAGQLSVFVGGDEEAFNRTKARFLAIANPERLFYGGESGKGQVLKIIQQLKDRILTLGRLEVLAFGVNEEIPMETVLSVLGEDPDGNGGYATTARNIAEGNDYALSCMFAEWNYYLEEAEDAGIPLPIISAVREFYKDGELTSKDNVGRPGPWLWYELTGEPKKGNYPTAKD